MQLSLLEIDKPRAEWVSQISLAFIMCGGYMLNETEGELDVTFSNIHDTSFRVLLRDAPHQDVNTFFGFMLNQGFPLAKEVMSSIYQRTEAPLQIIDVSAQSGFASLYFKRVFPHATILALEMNQANRVQLEKNIAINGLSDIHPIRAALWHTNTPLLLSKPNSSNDEQQAPLTELRETTNEPEHIVKGITLSTLLETYRWQTIDILKLDAFSAHVLIEKDPNLPTLMALTQIIVIEINDASEYKRSILEALAPNGFEWQEESEAILAWKELTAYSIP